MNGNRSFALARLLVLAVIPAMVARADLQDELFSGPQVGERLAELNVQRVYGPVEGVQLNLAKFATDGDSMLIFVNGANRPAAQLTRALLNYAEMLPRKKLFAAMVWLDSDRTAAKDYLARAISWWGVGLPVGISMEGGEGPGSYGLNRNVNLTILISRKNEVTSNFALVQPSLTDAPRIFKALSDLTGSRVPNADELQFLAMPTRKLSDAPWVAASQNVELRRRICHLLAADNDTDALTRAEQLKTWVADRSTSRKRLHRLSSELSEGRRKIRGETALPYVRQWKRLAEPLDIAALPKPSDQKIRAAAKRAVQLMDTTSAKFLETRKCFTCHTQTLSAMVLKDAQAAGFEIDEQNLKRQVQRAFSLHRFTVDLEKTGIRVDTVGHGLWTLDIGKHPSDEMTTEMVEYVLHYEKDLGHWRTTVDRPPTEASSFTTNYVAIRGLNRYGSEDQQDKIAARIDAVKQWLAVATTKETEDDVFLLRLANELKISDEKKESIVRKLLREQCDDGGWAQKPGMKPDAYATGSVLVALHEAGGLPCDHPSWQHGIDFLLRTQKHDGSWHVVTRAAPIQVYFESGFPHGEDQFISVFATGWATKALLLSLREANSKPDQDSH